MTWRPFAGLFALFVVGCGAGGPDRENVIAVLTSGTWELKEETGGATQLPTNLFQFYEFTPEGEVVGSDGVCAGVISTFHVENGGRLVLDEPSAKERRTQAVDMIVADYRTARVFDDDAPLAPSKEDVEQAYLRSKIKAEPEWTELERRVAEAFSALKDPLPINEFHVRDMSAGRLVLEKLGDSGPEGLLRFAPRGPVTPATFGAR